MGDAHTIEGTKYLWEANEEGAKFIIEMQHLTTPSRRGSVAPVGLYLQELVTGPSRTRHKSQSAHATADMVPSSL